MNTFNKARAAKLNHKTAVLVRELQKASFNSSTKEVNRILEELNEHPEMINEINRRDPSLLLAVSRLMPAHRDKIQEFVKIKI